MVSPFSFESMAYGYRANALALYTFNMDEV